MDGGGLTMTPEAINQVVDHLANKLSIPAGKLLEMLPRLGYKSVVTVIWFFFTMLVSGILLMFFIRMYEKNTDSDMSIIMVALCAVVASACILGMLFMLPDALFWLHDPQAWALDYVLKLMR